jgi:hypothetical protein
MKQIIVFISLISIFLGDVFAQEINKSPRELLFKESLISILKFEKPARFAVLNSSIVAEEIARQKVPRHNPDFQFSKFIKGVTPELELSLLYNNMTSLSVLNTNASSNLESYEHFDFTNIDVGQKIDFLGILSTDQSNEEIKKQIQNQSGDLIIIKFAQIAIKGDKALVYGESKYIPFGPKATPVGSGYGLLFQSSKGHWHLVTMKPMWAGQAAF